MQEAQASTSTPETARRGLRPMAAVGITAAVLLVGSGIAYLIAGTGENPPARPAPAVSENPTPDPEAEVIAALEALLALKEQAFDTRNLDLLSEIYVDGSAVENRARRGLSELIRLEVYDHGRDETKDMQVEELDVTEAKVNHRYVYFPCFRNAAGEDITDATGVLKDQTIYTLRQENGKWQIYRAELVAEQVLVREKSSCARV